MASGKTTYRENAEGSTCSFLLRGGDFEPDLGNAHFGAFVSKPFNWNEQRFHLLLWPYGRDEGNIHAPYRGRYFSIMLYNFYELDATASVTIGPSCEGASVTRVVSSLSERDNYCFDGSGERQRYLGWTSFARRDGFFSQEADSTSLEKCQFTVRLASKHEAICAKWVSTPGRVRGSMLNLLEDPDASYADIQLTDASGAVVRAHQCVLCTESEFFAMMFANGDFKEAQTKVVKFDDISSIGLDIVVRYLYGANLSQSLGFQPGEEAQKVELLLEVWRFASVSLIKDLEGECVDILCDSCIFQSYYIFDAVVDIAITLSSSPVVRSCANFLHDVVLNDLLDCELDCDGEFRELLCENISAGKLIALLREMPFTIGTLGLAHEWLERDLEEREKHGTAIFEVLPLHEFPDEVFMKPSEYRLAGRFAKPSHLKS